MENDMISSFKGEYAWLSNMYETKIQLGNLTFKCSESAYQGMKDLSRLVDFQNLEGKTAKALSKTVTLRNDWENIKIGVMLTVVRAKFIQNEELKEKLIATGNTILVEGNTWHDNIWGKCTCEKCSNVKGTNYLGRILMRVRKELQENRAYQETKIESIPNFDVLTSKVYELRLDKYFFPIICGFHGKDGIAKHFSFNTITRQYSECILGKYCENCQHSQYPEYDLEIPIVCQHCEKAIHNAT